MRTRPSNVRRRLASATVSLAAALIACGLAVDLPVAASAQKPRKSVATPAGAATPAAAVYFPPRGEWQQQTPDAEGMDRAKLDRAIAYAVANENPATKDLALDIAAQFGREPFDTVIGPVRPRAALNGLVIRHGAIVAEWGETRRVDMTFSVTKTFLSTVVGLAYERGLIRDLHDRVVDYMPTPELFDTPHNAAITWDDMLRQTSDWHGTLWGKPDWADRPEGEKPSDYPNRPEYEPGAHYKYNDVRVNVLAIAARAGNRSDVSGKRQQHHLCRLGARPRGRGAVDPGWYCVGYVPGAGPGGDQRIETRNIRSERLTSSKICKDG